MSINKTNFWRLLQQKSNETVRGTNVNSNRGQSIRGIDKNLIAGGNTAGQIGNDAIADGQLGNVLSSTHLNLQHSILPLVSDVTVKITTNNSNNIADIQIYGVGGIGTVVSVYRPDQSILSCSPVLTTTQQHNFSTPQTVYCLVYYDVFHDANGNGKFVAVWKTSAFTAAELAIAYQDNRIPIVANPVNTKTGLTSGTLGTYTQTLAGPGGFPVASAGGSGIASINADTTSAQVIAAGTGISVVTGSGTTTITNTGSAGRTTYSSVILADSPTFYYQCRDLSGTVCTDDSGNGNNGSYVNTPLLGHASLCGDVNDYALHTGVTSGQVGIQTTTLPNTSHFTIEGIFENTRHPIDTSHNSRILATDSFGAGSGFALALNSSNMGFYINFNVTGSGGLNTVQVGGFYSLYIGRNHIALVFTGTGIIIYVNGIAVYTSPAMSGTYVPGTYSKIFIGHDVVTTIDQFVGSLDEISLYPVALTAVEILAHAQAMFTQ